MNCPDCDSELRGGATTCRCGWKLPRQVLERPVAPDDPPANPARVRAILAELEKKMAIAPARPVAKPMAPAFQPVTVGHGSGCVCEGCYQIRIGLSRARALPEREAGADFEEDAA